MTVTKKLLLLAIVLLTVISIPKLAYSKSYSYDYMNLNLDLYQNGSVVVSQERAYNFVGSFSFAYLDLLKKGAQDIQFIEIKDLDTNTPLHFDLERDSSHVKATWYYSATNQVKRFLIVYRIDGAIKRYEDVADFYWKVIEDSHERIDRLDSTINIPSSSPNLFKVFIHSSANPGELRFSEDLKTAYVSMQNIPTNTFVEFRVLTEPGIFSVQEIPYDNYENILNEEKNIFSRSTIFGFLTSIWFLVLIASIAIFSLSILYLKFGIEPKVEYDLTYEQEPPHKIPPMALANLIEGEEEKTMIKLDAMGLLATLFDLARRGYLEIREEKKIRFLGLGEKTEQVFILTTKGKNETKHPSKSSLKDFELDIISFVFGCGSKSDAVTSSEITHYCKMHRISVRDKIEGMDEKARDWFEKNIFKITEKASGKVMRNFRAVTIGCGVITLFIYYYTRNLLFLIPAGAFLISFVGSVSISRRTPQSMLEVKRWKAFRKYISDFSAMKDAPATLLHIWDEYLVYAIVLGVAKKLLENIKNLSLERNQPIAAVAWYHGLTPMPTGAINPEALSAFVDNLSNTINALNSSTSVGGGFSGGGGGGGGGGGSGAG